MKAKLCLAPSPSYNGICGVVSGTRNWLQPLAFWQFNVWTSFLILYAPMESQRWTCSRERLCAGMHCCDGFRVKGERSEGSFHLGTATATSNGSEHLSENLPQHCQTIPEKVKESYFIGILVPKVFQVKGVCHQLGTWDCHSPQHFLPASGPNVWNGFVWAVVRDVAGTSKPCVFWSENESRMNASFRLTCV